VAQFMADASQLGRLAASTAPLVDDFPRRLSPERRAMRYEPALAWLVQADRSRERLDASQWLSNIVPKELLARAGPRFDERRVLDEEFFPYLQRPPHNYWRNVAQLLGQPGLRTWKLWLLGSEARKVEIAKSKDPADPLVEEQMAIEALAMGRKPEPVRQERFMAMTSKGQLLTVLRHCLAGDRARARSLIAWIPARNDKLTRDFLEWARGSCS
jgi:hypothetical protein